MNNLVNALESIETKRFDYNGVNKLRTVAEENFDEYVNNFHIMKQFIIDVNNKKDIFVKFTEGEYNGSICKLDDIVFETYSSNSKYDNKNITDIKLNVPTYNKNEYGKSYNKIPPDGKNGYFILEEITGENFNILKWFDFEKKITNYDFGNVYYYGFKYSFKIKVNNKTIKIDKNNIKKMKKHGLILLDNYSGEILNKLNKLTKQGKIFTDKFDKVINIGDTVVTSRNSAIIVSFVQSFKNNSIILKPVGASSENISYPYRKETIVSLTNYNKDSLINYHISK